MIFGKPDKEMLRQLALDIGGTYDGTFIQLDALDSRFEIRYYGSIGGGRYGNSAVLSRLVVAADVVTSSRFDFFVEGLLEKALKLLALEKEYQSGFPEFDNRFLLRIDDEDLARKLFSDSNVRQLISQTFDSGFSRIYADGQELAAEIAPVGLSEVESKAVKQAVACLSELKRVLG